MKIGIIGAGKIGSTVAKLWVQAGHEVMIASRHPMELKSVVEPLGPRAHAGTPPEAAAFGEVVMLTVPLKAVPDVSREVGKALDGKVVLDTSNAYDGRDGEVAREASENPSGSAGWAAAMFPTSRWVKAFNTVYFKTLEIEARRSGDRLGIPLASDDPEALEVAAKLVRDAGFEPVIADVLARGEARLSLLMCRSLWSLGRRSSLAVKRSPPHGVSELPPKEFEPNTAVYNTGMSGSQVRAKLGIAA